MRTSRARSRSWLYVGGLLRCCLATVVSVPFVASVHAASITVNTLNQVDAGQCTIATAIASVNAGADQAGCTHTGTYGTSDTVVLSNGTYTLTTANNDSNAFPIIQKIVTINGNSATLSRTVGAVAPFFRFFEVDDEGLTINNVTLTGGNVPAGDGGAIQITEGPLTVSGCTFSNNSAAGGNGGAIYNTAIQAMSVSNTTFSNNTVSSNGDGGAIYHSGIAGMTLVDVTFTSNTANGGNGGAIYDTSANGPTITNGTFTGNTATGGDGGAIYDSSGGSLVINGGSFTNNSVSPNGNGGAIYDTSSDGLDLTNVTFTNNTASADGGAIYDSSGGGLSFNGGSMTSNSVGASGNGGGIYDTSGGGVNITNVVFTSNSGGNGGALYDFSGGTGPVNGNCFIGNTAAISGGGVFRGDTQTLNAINNWWNSASGPSEAGPGTGDGVSTFVTFSPFLTSPPVICSGVAPVAKQIPTQSEWTLALMTLMLLSAGIWSLRRRRR